VRGPGRGTQGTRLRANQQFGHRTMHTATRQAYSWGWKPTVWSNKSAGIAILVSHALSKGVVCTYEPPAKLAGRVGALRIRTSTQDLSIFSVYAPPPSTLHHATHSKLIDALHAWIGDTISRAPVRTCPIIMGDLNTGFAAPDHLESDGRIGPSGWGRRTWTTG
jgi:hypothetical protein